MNVEWETVQIVADEPYALSFKFPWPPSTNHLFASGGGRRFKTKAYNSFLKACQGVTLVQKIPRYNWGSNRLQATLCCHAPSKHAYDLDNRCKATLDAMQHCGIIDDDGRIDLLHMIRGSPSLGAGYVLVSLSTAL